MIAHPLYGYANVYGKIAIVPEKTEVVRKMLTMALSGIDSHGIAKILNKGGVISKKNCLWHASMAQGILKNEKYTGNVIFQKTFTDESFNRYTNYEEGNMYLCKNHHEAIISHEVFDMVAEQIISRRGQEKSHADGEFKHQNRYSLSGKLICSEYGSTLKRRIYCKPSGDYIAWGCNGHLNDKDSCGMLYVKDDAGKLAFARMMNKLLVGQAQIIKLFIGGICGFNNKDLLHQINDLE